MRTRHRAPGLWPGLILVSVGGGLLAREFGYLPPHLRLIDFWPLFVVFIGISGLLQRRGFVGALFSLAFIAMGGLLLAGNLGFIAFQAARLWPLLLVLLGLAFMFRAGRGNVHVGPSWTPPDGGGSGSGGGIRHYGVHSSAHPRAYGAQTSDENRLAKQITFSGAQLRIESQDWKGGELGVTAGGVELDLRNARLNTEGALLDLRVLMGGVDIRVPDTWQVILEVTPFLGGADDVSRSTQGASGSPRLRVIGTVTLGGVTVRN
jgi:hypothetical protein